MKYLIIGNGVAGSEAAANIRKHDPAGDITIISESSYPMYYRPRLIECLSGEVAIDDIIFYPQEWYQKNNIKVVLEQKVLSIDRKEKKVITATANYDYDRLLLAVGARPFVPPLPGIDLPGVFSLRSADDAEAIYNYCLNRQHIVVIGGGLLGIETANCLLGLVDKVTIVEFSDHLLPKQLDERGASVLKDALSKKGINFILGDSAEAVLGQKAAEGVRLKSKKEIQADAVIFSIGVRARLELANQLDLEVKRGIIVDEGMATSQPDIFAAGDVIEFKGRGFGLWLPAKEQGKIAGENMVGKESSYVPAPLVTRLKVTGISLFSAGKINDETADMMISVGEGQYRKLVIKDGKLIGAIILDDPEEEKVVAKILNGKADLKEVDLTKYKKLE